MLGPSPDWIVGVSGLELCQKNCTWLESKELFLYPWDAGVDSGISYESPDQATEPQQNISRSAYLMFWISYFSTWEKEDLFQNLVTKLFSLTFSLQV